MIAEASDNVKGDADIALLLLASGSSSAGISPRGNFLLYSGVRVSPDVGLIVTNSKGVLFILSSQATDLVG